MPPRRDGALREAIVAAARKMQALGLSPGRPGNISVRRKDGMPITAPGIRPEDMDPDSDVVFVDRTRSGGGCECAVERMAFPPGAALT